MTVGTAESEAPVGAAGRVTVAWLAGVVLAGIGTGLAVVALTLPWVSATMQQAVEALPITAIARFGPLFAVLLVLSAVAAAVGFAGAARSSRVAAVVAAGCGPVVPIFALWVGWQPPEPALRAGAEAVRPDWEVALQAGAPLSASPAPGLYLYAVGALLISLGVAVSAGGSAATLLVAPARVGEPSLRARRIVGWGALVLALPLAVLSLSWPWFEITADDWPPAVEGWQTVYRAGLVLTFFCAVGIVLTAGVRRRIWRAVGVHCVCAVGGVLALNAILVWDPYGTFGDLVSAYASLSLGGGFVAGAAAVLALAYAFVLAPVPGEGPSEDDTEDDNAAVAEGEPA
ncbi:hypothetical protein [Prauserella rugosa]|uniref:Uncharacterized protein n=1 Tax=Prauserella rugosa TaxID=43354 RepID=A0A660CGR7_9PSEU|nr:hypothetical protein [Prauserella rugosa]TWH21067.1 hypothetical protein JD82_02920 [Prauserella rugosa]